MDLNATECSPVSMPDDSKCQVSEHVSLQNDICPKQPNPKIRIFLNRCWDTFTQLESRVSSNEQGDLSITQWMHLAKEGDVEAQRELWVRYYERLVRLAKNRLRPSERRVLDEEDVVIEAFNAFFQALESNGLSGHENRDDLWRMLVTIADNKAKDLGRQQRRLKRGGGRIRGHSVMVGLDDDCPGGFEKVPDPTPEFADEFSLSCEHLLGRLNESQRQLAMWKLAGLTNKEIAQKLGCVEEAVRRKVLLIRSIWEQESKST